jgi:hypothetical protein
MAQTPPTVSPELLTPLQLSQLIGISPAVLSNWRRTGMGPAYIKLGKSAKAKVRYPIEQVQAWKKSFTLHMPSVAQNVEAALAQL